MMASYNSPCAACKFLRRKCMPGCIFAPYFPPEEPQKFANVHKIFGASNVTKLLNDILPQQREDAVNSLAYEAEARVRDPVYGCVGAISFLQRQVDRLQKELDAANADLIRYAACNDNDEEVPPNPNPNPYMHPITPPQRSNIDHHYYNNNYPTTSSSRNATAGGFIYDNYQLSPLLNSNSYHQYWNNNNNNNTSSSSTAGGGGNI